MADLKMDDVRAVIAEMTDKPWFSWAAHYDQRRRAIYWGSDFLMEVRHDSSLDDVRAAIQDYIENRMAER